jgi:hypothetical protein
MSWKLVAQLYVNGTTLFSIISKDISNSGKFVSWFRNDWQLSDRYVLGRQRNWQHSEKFILGCQGYWQPSDQFLRGYIFVRVTNALFSFARDYWLPSVSSWNSISDKPKRHLQKVATLTYKKATFVQYIPVKDLTFEIKNPRSNWLLQNLSKCCLWIMLYPSISSIALLSLVRLCV